MPYSPIRLEQLNTPQISGYVLNVVDTVYVSTSGVQDIYGVKTFYSGAIFYGSDTNLALNSTDRTLSGNWQYNSQTAGPSGIVNTSFLNTGYFNPTLVRTTGDQSIAGTKTFLEQVDFTLPGSTVSIGGPWAGFWVSGPDHFLNLELGQWEDPSSQTSIQFDDRRLSGNWEVQNLKANSTRINRRQISGTGYTVLSSDYYLAVNTSVSQTRLIFPAVSDNRAYKVKDIAGNATGFNIILSGSGVTFDNSPTYVISDAYASIELIAGSGSNYEVF